MTLVAHAVLWGSQEHRGLSWHDMLEDYDARCVHILLDAGIFFVFSRQSFFLSAKMHERSSVNSRCAQQADTSGMTRGWRFISSLLCLQRLAYLVFLGR